MRIGWNIMMAALSIVSASSVSPALAEPATQRADEGRVQAYRDVQFAEVAGRKLFLDLAVLTGVDKPPLVVMIHGGGWRSGKRNDPASDRLANWIVAHSFATARIDYRKSNEAPFPAQIFDCKAAVRWLRAHADQYGYDQRRIAVLGESAGGYLAVLLATTAKDRALEGDVGGNLDQSSDVQAVIDLFGPTDFLQRAKDQPDETEKPDGKVYQLLGGPVGKNLDLARQASGLYHVSAGAPPLLVLHGSKDSKVLLNQSQRLFDAYKSQGLEVTLHLVDGAGHGGPEFYEPEPLRIMTDFLDTQLRKVTHTAQKQ